VKAARIVTVIAFAALGIALPVAAFGSAAHTAANTQTYPDSTGEDPSAPDITSVVVSNDDAGNITFKIDVSNRPTFTSDMAFFLLLNTDNNTSTGDTDLLGSDYLVELDPGAVGLGKWNGSNFDFSVAQSSLTFSYDATGATIHVSQADLGGVKVLAFAAEAISGIVTDASGNPDLTNAHRDLAPDPGHGLFTYNVLTKLILARTAFTTTPVTAKAGSGFSASLAATENDTNGPVTGATITCVATLKGKRLPATHALGNGVASCFWRLPKTAKGLTLRGTITVTKQGAKLVKSFAVKVH